MKIYVNHSTHTSEAVRVTEAIAMHYADTARGPSARCWADVVRDCEKSGGNKFSQKHYDFAVQRIEEDGHTLVIR